MLPESDSVRWGDGAHRVDSFQGYLLHLLQVKQPPGVGAQMIFDFGHKTLAIEQLIYQQQPFFFWGFFEVTLEPLVVD